MLMKKILPLLFLVIGLANACRDKTSTTKSNAVKADTAEIAVVVADTVKPAAAESPVTENPAPEVSGENSSRAADSIDFKKYGAELIPSPVKAEIDWKSYPEARNFRTRIIEGYKDGEVNFAGHYIAVVFGCGAGCVLGFMVDVRDGQIYDLPLGEENSCFFMEDAALMRPDSRLFISAVCKEEAESARLNYKAYLWDEENKSFSKIEATAFVKN